jgi:predicted DNA-binding protein with PD1-like motif
MRYTRLGDTWIVRLMTGEEIAGAIVDFAVGQRIDAGHVSGIGAACDVALGFFDRTTREYVRQTFREEMEILSLSGTIAIKEGRPFGHLHATFGRRDFTTVGGHLFEARTGATCELVIQPLAGYLQRVKDEATGLFLLDV